MRSNLRRVRAIVGLVAAVAVCAPMVGAWRQDSTSGELPAGVGVALDRISADSLRGHLSFIASDLLEGRATPSPGLDLAAEYIAAQFRRAGIEPAGDGCYFQTSHWREVDAGKADLKLAIDIAGKKVSLDASQARTYFDHELDVGPLRVVKLAGQDVSALNSLGTDGAEGAAILTDISPLRLRGGFRRSAASSSDRDDFVTRLKSLKPALLVSVDRRESAGSEAGRARLIDPRDRADEDGIGDPPVIAAYGPTAALFDSLPQGLTEGKLWLKSAAAPEKPVVLRNVVGLLRGSDPALKDTYVLVTAHYDHIGVRPGGPGDRIANGANDDGSGTVSVIELASVLVTLKTRPKRSIVFMAVFGEERGGLGSRYYARNPIFPLEKTVANVNLEQVGRTDSTEGPQVGTASLTGFDFSDVGQVFKSAGEKTGIMVYKHERNSDAYFVRSDNLSFAEQGIPAHTLCVAYNYPDYHGVGDHWDKIDYDNMARVIRMVGLAVFMIADDAREPRWNETNPKTEPYVKAWRSRTPN